MPLIKVKAPVPLLGGRRVEGMMPGSPLEPGAPPPWIIPHCAKCRLPVERFTVDWISSPHYLPVQFQCHGQTGGHYVPRDEALYKSQHGGITWVFTETKVGKHGKR